MAGGSCGLLLTKHRRAAFVFAAISMGLALPWTVWQTQQQPVNLSFVEEYYTATSYKYVNILTHFPIHDKLVIFSHNILRVIESPGLLVGCSSAALGLMVAFVFWMFALRGLVQGGAGPLAATTILSLLLLLVYSWEPWRYFVPILGFILLLVYAGVPRHVILGVLYIALATQALVGLWSLRKDAQTMQIVSSESAGFQATWSQIMDMETWLLANSSPDDVVISAMDPLTYLYTGRKAIRGSHLYPMQDFYGIPNNVDVQGEYVRLLNQPNVRYVVMEPNYYDASLTPSTQAFLRDGYLQEVHRSGPFRIYRLVRPPSG
jgi:hypothetical protein